MQIIGIFAEVEGAAFEKRLSAILPSINSAIKPSLYTAVSICIFKLNVMSTITM